MASPGLLSRPAKAQIEELPVGAFFWSKDLPGNPSTARAAMSRLAQDPDSGIRRLAPGLYWQGRVPAAGSRGRDVPAKEDVALVYAGAGAGYAKWGAVYALQWGHQGVRRSEIAVAGRQLRPPVPRLAYIRRRNLRRKDLTWTEVSVLEALAKEDMIEYAWGERLRLLGKGWSGWSVGGESREGVFRPAAVVWAAEADDLATPDVLVMAEEMQRSLPEIVLPANPAIPKENAA